MNIIKGLLGFIGSTILLMLYSPVLGLDIGAVCMKKGKFPWQIKLAEMIVALEEE